MNVILDEDDGANDADDITDDDVSFLNYGSEIKF